MRKKIVAANWKMNLNRKEALEIHDKLEVLKLKEHKELIIFSPFVYIDALKQKQNKVKIGSQNFYPAMSGAFTGEISISHLLDIQADYVLIGHSERRSLFKEDDNLIKEKIDSALLNNLKIVFCCGEPLDVREKNCHWSYVLNQLELNLFHLDINQFKNIVIAYEPIWAIGTGKTASVQQAEEMHSFIRKAIEQKYNKELAQNISILYGGSCNSGNSKELFNCENIDGGLIGGASLKIDDLTKIIESL